MIASLNNLQEQRWPILNILGKNLQQISIFIIINQNLQLLQNLQILFDFHIAVGQILAKHIIVSIRNGQEMHAASAQIPNGLDDIVGIESDMLNASTTIILDILFDLRLSLSRCRFIDGHLDSFLIVGHHNGSQ